MQRGYICIAPLTPKMPCRYAAAALMFMLPLPQSMH